MRKMALADRSNTMPRTPTVIARRSRKYLWKRITENPGTQYCRNCFVAVGRIGETPALLSTMMI